MTAKDVNTMPRTILGATWGPQNERMESGIYFPLFVVLVDAKRKYSIFYLPAGTCATFIDCEKGRLALPPNSAAPSASNAPNRWSPLRYQLEL